VGKDRRIVLSLKDSGFKSFELTRPVLKNGNNCLFCSMFTGIIEATGVVTEVISTGSNRTFWIESPLSGQFKPDQSVSHSGVCLTVEEMSPARHRVTAIDETLKKTNLGQWQTGTIINLERCLQLNDRLDGHIVQGHVDATAICTNREEKEGSWEFVFEFPKKFAELVIEKGSICVNGISLTAFNVKKKSFMVAIIPYTFEHTNIQQVIVGTTVNLEFDMIGKYLLRRLSLKGK
jgi:riboflavin synthase